jgi:WD40 repeat protein
MSRHFHGSRGRIALSAGLLTALLVIGIIGRPSPAIEPTGEKERPLKGDSLPSGAMGRLGSLAFRHAERVNGLTYTPDGKRLVTSADDQVIRIWDVVSGNMIQEIRGAESAIAGLAVSPDGKQLAANEHNGKLRAWDLTNGKELWAVEQPDYSGPPVRYSPDGKFLTGWYGQNTGTLRICRYDSATGKEVAAFEPPGGGITHVAVSKHGRMLALAGPSPEAEKPSSIVTLYGLSDHRRTRAITVPGQVTASNLSTDSRLLAVAAGRNIYVYETATGKEWHKMRVARGTIVQIFITPDGRRLGAQGQDGDLRTWGLETGEFEQTIHLQDAPLTAPNPLGPAPAVACGLAVPDAPNPSEPLSVTCSPDGKTLATASGDRSVRFWDLATGQERTLFDGHRGGVTALAVSPDGRLLASGGTDHTIRVWDLPRLQQIARFQGHTRPVTALIFSADGKQLTSGSATDSNVRVWDVAEGKELSNIDGKDLAGSDSSLELAPDGRRFAVSTVLCSGAEDGVVTTERSLAVFDVSREEKIRTVKLGSSSSPLGFAGANGQNAGVGGLNIGVFGTGFSGQPLLASLPVLPVVGFGPAGKTVAATTPEGVSWFSVPTGKRLGTFTTEPFGTQRIVFSPDGKTLAVSKSGSISQPGLRAFAAIMGAGRLALQNRARAGDGLRAFAAIVRAGAPPESDDDETSGETGSVIVLCDVATGKERARIEVEQVGGMTFSPDGQMLAVGGGEHQGHLWDVQTGRQLCNLKGHLGMVNTFAFSAEGKTLVSGSDDSTILIWDVSECLKKRSTPAVRQGQEEAAWNALIGDSPAEVREAMRSLSAAPSQALTLVSAHVRPIKTDDPRVKQVGRLVADLDSADFEVREKASKELEGMGEFAAMALEKALENNPGLEVRQRLEQVLAHIEEVDGTGELLAALRSIALLERIGTPAARKLLQSFADGAPQARRTLAAREALERLAEKQ